MYLSVATASPTGIPESLLKGGGGGVAWMMAIAEGRKKSASSGYSGEAKCRRGEGQIKLARDLESIGGAGQSCSFSKQCHQDKTVHEAIPACLCLPPNLQSQTQLCPTDDASCLSFRVAGIACLLFQMHDVMPWHGGHFFNQYRYTHVSCHCYANCCSVS